MSNKKNKAVKKLQSVKNPYLAQMEMRAEMLAESRADSARQFAYDMVTIAVGMLVNDQLADTDMTEEEKDKTRQDFLRKMRDKVVEVERHYAHAICDEADGCLVPELGSITYNKASIDEDLKSLVAPEDFRCWRDRYGND